MSGFWKFTNNYASKVNKILENENVSLEDLLDERETVSELLSSNAKLIEYIRRPEILEKLVDFIVDDDDYQRKSAEFESNNEFNNENSSNSGIDEMNGSSNGKITDDISNFPSDAHDHEKANEVDAENNNNNSNSSNSRNNNNIDFEKLSQDAEGLDTSIVDEDTKIEKAAAGKGEDIYLSNNEEDDDDENHNSGSESESNSDNEAEDNDEDDEEDEDEDGVDDDIDEEEKHSRRAQVAAEILSMDVWSITDAFMESVDLIKKLWCLLDKEPPLPIFSATYFMKINEHLLDMKTDEMIQFIHQEPNLVTRFMRHIETPPLMDFLLKVISTDKPDDSTGIIDVLKDQGLIPKLISFLDKSIPSSVQSAAGDFLKAFITISANNAENTTIGPNELTRQLVSEPMVKLLVEKMIQGGTGLSNGVGIVIEIIRKNNSDYDPVPVVYVTLESHPPTPRDPIYLGTLVKIFAENMPKFTELLEQKVEKMLPTPFGEIEPLGFERFKICELVAELIHCSNMALLNDIKGQAMVKERDEIRAILIAKHKELMKRAETDSQNSSEGIDVSKEIENLKSLIKQEGTVDDTSVDDEGENDENLQSGEGGFIDNEESLREHPIVGDQLKIALYDNKIIVTILDMFFRFPWNNFLHNVVFDIVQQILNATMEIGYNKYLAVDLFDRCHITTAIVQGHNKCIEYEEETGLRLGYMGHLSLIAEEVVKFISLDIHRTTPKSQIIDEVVNQEDWKYYVDETLADIRNKYNAVLGSDGKQMNEHDMNLFQQVYGSGEYDDEDEEDDDVILEGNDNMVNGYMESEENGVEADKFSRYLGDEMSNDLNGRYEDENEGEDENDTAQKDTDDLNQSDEFEGVVDSQMGGHPYHEMSAGGLDDDNIKIDDDYDIDNISDDDDVDEDEDVGDGNVVERYLSHGDYGDYDDYEDPNDDGQSYKKMNHPLYQADGSLRSLSNEKFSGSSSE